LCVLCIWVCHFVFLIFLLVNDKDSFFHFIFSPTKHYFIFKINLFLTRWAWWLGWGLYLLILTFFFNILAYWVIWFLFWAGFAVWFFRIKLFPFQVILM
jgi:hypothetical protein